MRHKSIVSGALKLGLLGLMILVLIGLRLATFPSAANYFTQAPERKLQEDEFGQWQYVRHLYTEMEATGDEFKGWDAQQQDLWKYAIAFVAYGMPSLAMIQPEDAPMISYTLSVMIHKMKSKKVWNDWQRYGFGQDPICKDNIMYKGHLNLMYGLYQLMSGSALYAKEFTWLTQRMAQEVDASQSGAFRGLVCEPDRYFVQCNAIGLLSFQVYDRIYGTHYAAKQGQQVLSFIKQRMVDPASGLYREAYHPSHDLAVPYLSGYTNAWTMVMLHPLDAAYQEQLYPRWKALFVKEWGPFAAVRETSYGGPSRLATLFGMLAAKEFGDRELFGKLRNSLDFAGFLHKDLELGYQSYALADNPFLNGLVLSFKLHQGWPAILQHDWPQQKSPHIPEIAQFSSKDLLDLNHLPL